MLLSCGSVDVHEFVGIEKQLTDIRQRSGFWSNIRRLPVRDIVLKDSQDFLVFEDPTGKRFYQRTSDFCRIGHGLRRCPAVIAHHVIKILSQPFNLVTGRITSEYEFKRMLNLRA